MWCRLFSEGSMNYIHILNESLSFFTDSVTLERFWLRVTHGSKTATKHNLSKINPWWRPRRGGGRRWRIERNHKPFINLNAIPQPYPQSPFIDSTHDFESDVSLATKKQIRKHPCMFDDAIWTIKRTFLLIFPLTAVVPDAVLSYFTLAQGFILKKWKSVRDALARRG